MNAVEKIIDKGIYSVAMVVCFLLASSTVMAIIMAFSMTFEALTGIDLIRDYIKPLFGG